MPEVSAVIVARANSQRVENKALQVLNKHTLLANKILQLKDCECIDRVIVGTDSDAIAAEAKEYGAEVVIRPDYYCDESVASANEMIGNMMELIETDVVVWAHCTNPFIHPDTYDAAVQKFLSCEDEGYDSLLSVIELKEHLWGPDKQVLNYNPYAERHTLSKDLPSYYMQDGGIFIQRHADMKANSYFFGQKPYLFEVPKDQFCDINTLDDLEHAIYRSKKK
ncbi:cytidylyltransferase domain-containing protein [Echinimonas agarilytica]|uniref:Acylneuraminate cytidylyltransferase family protein n=1 Tax=Echinimonas agarilytica TaxID=1215918 RepID=A0AA42B6I2_9GAMM|nr:acylneuraminate cytidylyltransferase family protein [Echinimonas agarilytica]MCM2678684.1 acylneuraminate cytidylyltransferase family protein [Echinimonas agarilytica]